MDELDDALAKVREELAAVRAQLSRSGETQRKEEREAEQALEQLEAGTAKLEHANEALEERVKPLRHQVEQLRAALAAKG